MRKWIGVLTVLAGVLQAAAFAPTEDQAAVNVRYASADRNVLIVEGKTYTLHLDLALAAITHFQSGGDELIGEYALVPILNTGAVKGPGRVNIYTFGTQMYEIHLRDLKWTDLDADIELVLYCYAKRVFANVNVTPRGTPPDLEVGWLGAAKYSIDIIKPMDNYAERLVWGGVRPSMVALAPRQRSADGQSIPTRAALEPPKRLLIGSKFASAVAGTRTASLILVAGESPEDLARLVYDEAHPEQMAFTVSGGTFDGYQPSKGFFQITIEYRGPREFETAWINPNQRYEVEVKVAREAIAGVNTHPSEIVCNVRNAYSVLEGAVLTDADGYPLPAQVQVSKNFPGEHEEGKGEADAPYSEAYFPVVVKPEAPFHGRLYHLFGNWGTHPLKQLSSIRFYHHYFHASLGPTETFCYVPFEFPRDDDRNYVWADVRGLTNTTWPGQPQHDHVSVIGALRYKSGGRWINNLLQDTRIYLTSPNLASFAMDYLSEDGKIKTTLEIFEAPQDDEARSFVKMKLDVLEPVDIEGGSAQNLRFINAGAYIVHTTWPKAAYTAADGTTAVVDVPNTGAWVLEGVTMGSPSSFAAAYPHKNGNIAFVVNRVSGRLGGQDVNAFGLSCFGDKDWTELFLTAPGNLTRLDKGDHLEAHFFVMPYGDANSDYVTAERQLQVYGPELAKVDMAHGKLYPGYPRRMKADSRGFAQFTLSGGENWTPLLVEGFESHRGLMLWEKLGDRWLLHDQQISGNDWYQSYRASDNSLGFVIVVKLRQGQTHQYLVTQAANARSIRQHNGFVRIEGGPMKFVSPVRFSGITNSPLEGTELFLCAGDAEQATSE